MVKRLHDGTICSLLLPNTAPQPLSYLCIYTYPQMMLVFLHAPQDLEAPFAELVDEPVAARTRAKKRARMLKDSLDDGVMVILSEDEDANLLEKPRRRPKKYHR